MSDLYETDFTLWSEPQAQALHRRTTNEIDWDNVAEEIESLGKNGRRDLASHIETVLDHLIRLQASPATQPHRAWNHRLIVQREAIRRLLNDSPSLRREIAGIIAEELPTAAAPGAARSRGARRTAASAAPSRQLHRGAGAGPLAARGAAAAGVYRTQLDRRQYLAEQMRSGGRGREIIAALDHGV